MKKAGGGAYVAVITAAVERVPVRDICSAAPKAAIEMLMRGVAKEEGRFGVRANCVGPGWIDAGLGREVMRTELTEEHIEQIRRSIPLRRIGQPEDIAEAVVFLLSSKASFISGQSLAVDGGMQL
ncbi:2-(S)-hydroxypropyl-CoM dehydrogenase [compost metagenome]